jgi:hypothetical protein
MEEEKDHLSIWREHVSHTAVSVANTFNLISTKSKNRNRNRGKSKQKQNEQRLWSRGWRQRNKIPKSRAHRSTTAKVRDWDKRKKERLRTNN